MPELPDINNGEPTMTMICMGSMWFGQGPWATLNVEWRNDRGAWERHSIHMIGTDENRTNHVTLDNGVTEYDPARLRPWHTPSSEDPKTGQENTHAD